MDDRVECPDCGDPVVYAFTDTSGVGAWKRGEGYNTTPDSRHYLCFPCEKAWKQRLDGPLTPDIVGDMAFFSCRDRDCSGRLTVINAALEPTAVELDCGRGHRYAVRRSETGELTLASL
jgi:hypothetical protein